MKIELVKYREPKSPVVYEGKVYQMAFLDWDSDLWVKDDKTGTKRVPKEDWDSVCQLAVDGEIHKGETVLMQLMVDGFNM